jgi:hypothetical protein
MGLDMYLEARKFISSYTDAEKFNQIISESGFRTGDIPHSTYASVNIQVMYWRKANHIHNWFVQNVQDGEDDCKTYHVSRNQLKELLETCEKVLTARDENTSQDLLPVTVGFFFGGTDYDEYYYESVEETALAIEKLLKNPAFEGMDFHYASSW